MALALYTFGMFAAPAEGPANDGFRKLNDQIFELVDQAEGLIAPSGYASDPGPSPWGLEVYAWFYRETCDDWSPATLSLWTNMESLFSFTYFGLHAAALRRGREWFQRPQWPPLVMWWHTGQGYPTWAEGVMRHEHLHDNGASPTAFDFKQPFDETRASTELDRARFKKLRASRA
ncbi:DUF3291 domain-containing protein [Paracoccus liaowanqingii]|uniref:DUF3291 domain-containing protein n=1 Tax=Paracoccus liaowanqingii TaxID=2560053 RepID=A0A4Z1CDG6_9RHOB|nr:DUF3291 domain-containing protein [Paracoccus liaowanqingii]TGN44435.1 DUF3291 domain-containing protein [Paracoccus liaowanqingii]